MQKKEKPFFQQLQEIFDQLVERNHLKKVQVQVKAWPLKPEEAIGCPKRKDYVLLKGKERLVQAEVMGHKGQAFTSSLGDYAGTLEELMNLPLDNDFHRAVYIATFNAVASYTGNTGNTLHCRNEGPGKCSMKVADFFRQTYGNPKILMLGYQPTLAESLVREFEVRVLDLDPANIGKTINEVHILDGSGDMEPYIKNADVIFATGSILCNQTIERYYNRGIPLVLYGTTGAGTAALLNLPRFCPESTEGAI